MNCEEKQAAFKDKLVTVQAALQSELEQIAEDTERQAKKIADDFEADNDLAAGVGAAAGTAIGAYFGGPIGGAAGGSLGKLIGSLFTLEIGMRRETVVLNVPQTTMETQDFSFDLPTVVIRDSDISFDLPVIEMRRQRGPDLPETRTRMETRCIDFPWPVGKVCADVPVVYVEMVPSYLDVPVTVMRTQRIVIGLPQLEMRRQEVKLDLPRISMEPTEFSADVPYVTLRFVKDAGKRTAALAAALAQSAQDAANQKQIGFKQRLKQEVAPLAIDMFRCYRENLLSARTEAASRIEPQISTLSGSLAALVAKGVPESDDDYIETKKMLDDSIAQRDVTLKTFDEALSKLDSSTEQALKQFLGDEPQATARGGLIKNTPPMSTPTATNTLKTTNGLIYYWVDTIQI